MKYFKVSRIALTLILSASLLYGCGGMTTKEKIAGTGGDNSTSTPDTDGDTGGAAKFTTETQKLLAIDPGPNQRFGYSVDIDGNYAIVGTKVGNAAGNKPGVAYIYHYDSSTGQWDSGYKLTAPDAEDGDEFGISVGISGDYAIVGAWHETSFGDFAGAAYIFHRTGTNSWDSGTKVVPSEISADLRYGYAVAIDGDYAVVGAAKSNGVYVFHRTGTNSWDSGVKLVDPENGYLDSFGTAVAIDGDYVVAGVQGRNFTSNSTAGTAYIYHRTGTNSWDGGTEIVSSDLARADHFGSSVSISGDYAVVGAAGHRNSNGDYAGAAYVFHRTGINSWDTGIKIVSADAGADDSFGYSVGISGDYIVVGDWGNVSKGDYLGAAYLFNRTATNSWSNSTKLLSSDIEAKDIFGSAVAISPNHLIAGSDGEDEGGSAAGAAYIFK